MRDASSSFDQPPDSKELLPICLGTGLLEARRPVSREMAAEG